MMEMDSSMGMFGYKDVTSRVTSKVEFEQLSLGKSVITSRLFDKMCGISLTIGFKR